MKKKIAGSLVGVLVTVLILFGGTGWWMYFRLADENRRLCAEKSSSDARPNGGGDAPLETVAPAAATDGAATDGAATEAAGDEAEGPRRFSVVSASSSETSVDLQLTAKPDMRRIRDFVTVGPLRRGVAGFAFEMRWRYDGDDWRQDEPHLIVSGDFALRKKIQLKIKKGLPSDEAGVPALAEDYVHTFARPDIRPSVGFVHKGRYLPPCGDRRVVVTSVNLPEVVCTLRRVEPKNVVQMLAREESVYSCYRNWFRNGDEADVDELSGASEKRTFVCTNAPNETSLTAIPVRMNDGKSRNGVYWLAVSGKDAETAYRVVCLSDLGLSVRKSADGVGVWVTSLLTGRPQSDVIVDVYSSANVLLAQGKTGDGGWASIPVDAEKGEPFVVVAYSPEGTDMTFIALRQSCEVDETPKDGARANYLADDDVGAFLWTERGIYRHDENIFTQAILRDRNSRAAAGRACVLELVDPKEKVFASKQVVADAEGTVSFDRFAVPAEKPSGTWSLVLREASTNRVELARRNVRIEEFAPPQIRVTVASEATLAPSNFAFTVTGAHLFGGPARDLPAEGVIVFEDVPFSPKGWTDYSFVNVDRRLRKAFRSLERRTLDEKGEARFEAPLLPASGLPKAAVKAIAQGTVFELGGRPANARSVSVLHAYPYYIGVRLPEWVHRAKGGRTTLDVACVTPAGERLAEGRQLVASLERVDWQSAYVRNDSGRWEWKSEKTRQTVVAEIPLETRPDGDSALELPDVPCGDYILTIADAESNVAFAKEFYLSDGGDDDVRVSREKPTEVTLVPDRPLYRPGETPRLVIKSPFPGTALVTVVREGVLAAQVLSLTNATAEIELSAVDAAWAPNVDVAVSVVQSVEASARHLAVRAHGFVTLPVRARETEIDVADIRTTYAKGRLGVTASAPGATHATVTVVDEGINLLTDEPKVDPLAALSAVRTADRPLFDLFGRILPVYEGDLKARGVKTGGGGLDDLLSRVSPTPSRRFKPLARWTSVPVVDGSLSASFDLGEFAGEVRVTVVACSDRATGSAIEQTRIAPKVVQQPDAPRFVAPDDLFNVSLPIFNRSGERGLIAYSIVPVVSRSDAKGCVFKTALSGDAVSGEVELADGGVTNVIRAIRATDASGEIEISYVTSGFGERHEETLRIPVRPAVAWRETAGVRRVETNAAVAVRSEPVQTPTLRYAERLLPSSAAQLQAAFDWLADYPHGCLEQTTSRVFPLLTQTNAASVVRAGVRRVESMVRANDFVMWPDAADAPWDREVSLYAAHFLFAAERAGTRLEPVVRNRVRGFLRRWAGSTNDSVAVYALLGRTHAGDPDVDRQNALFERRAQLNLLDRARLALAFAETGDAPKAKTLLARVEAPGSIREASFALLALLRLDPADARLPTLVSILESGRDKSRFAWGTTGENAHALLALGAYYRACPITDATAFVAWRKLELPRLEDVRPESSGLTVDRTFLNANGTPVNLSDLRCGDLVVVELTVMSQDARELSDLVVEDLFPACFEPVIGADLPALKVGGADWVMRSDARDDRMLVFSKKLEVEKNETLVFRYAVRVVAAGDYVLPGPSVEAMYHPQLRARAAGGRLVVRD